MSGWISYEQEGPEEMWLLDIPKRRVKFIHEGKTTGWQLWDYSTQSLSPTWVGGSDEVVFGDSMFGIERVNLKNRRVVRILGANFDAHDVQVSAKGDWIAFERWSDEELCSRCFGVTNRSGEMVVYLPEGYLDQFNIWSAWHPDKNKLAIISKNSDDNHYLLLWDLSELEK
jgi:hypothetical protein